MNVTEKTMNKKYVKPLCKVVDVDAWQIICGSDNPKMEYSNTEKASHSGIPEEDVLVKVQSCWESEW